MNYELAKKLKDAGWKRKTRWFYGIDETGGPRYTSQDSSLDTVGIRFVGSISEKIVDCYAPTLSELIEACGDDFEMLRRIFNKSGEFKFWTVEATNRTGICCDGETADEAVARLWIVLNHNEKEKNNKEEEKGL